MVETALFWRLLCFSFVSPIITSYLQSLRNTLRILNSLERNSISKPVADLIYHLFLIIESHFRHALFLFSLRMAIWIALAKRLLVKNIQVNMMETTGKFLSSISMFFLKISFM